MLGILILSFGIKEYDGRLNELCNVASKIGNYELVCFTKDENSKDYLVSKNKHLSVNNYIKFLLLSLKIAKEMKEIDILILDNMFSTIPGTLVKTFYKPKFVVQDVRELYFYKDIKNTTGKIFSFFETYSLKRADVVLCANKFRAEIMFKHYKLSKMPIVFENIRFLNGTFDKQLMKIKYRSLFNHKYNIINTGGYSLSRKTADLVSSMEHLSDEYGLYIVGEGTIKDKETIEKIMFEKKINNVYLLGKVPMNELRFFLRQCDIGIVSYHKNDLNNFYCASGKVYEYLAEGIPIVTTENLPLKDFCTTNEVGIADDSFVKGIIELTNKLEFYKEKVVNYINNVSPELNNNKVSKEILNELWKIGLKHE
ncbi:glycosyltransferase [Carnobacterium sp.]|uniref:glycosyltransferase n=1 Tax=Carnobacterium sp. TaxID=48221 RepID=UPI0028AD4A76|nr:glycosyltransferase [Carnobacterium sp.]